MTYHGGTHWILADAVDANRDSTTKWTKKKIEIICIRWCPSLPVSNVDRALPWRTPSWKISQMAEHAPILHLALLTLTMQFTNTSAMLHPQHCDPKQCLDSCVNIKSRVSCLRLHRTHPCFRQISRNSNDSDTSRELQQRKNLLLCSDAKKENSPQQIRAGAWGLC